MTKPATLTERLATFTLDLTPAAVPLAEVHWATRLLADMLAGRYAGLRRLGARPRELAESSRAYARRRSSAERSTATLLGRRPLS